MLSRTLNVVSLILYMIGTALLYFFGRSRSSFERGAGGRFDDVQDSEVRRRYNRLSKIGLFLISIAFLLQLCATLLI
jgi:hypothetical protein